MCHLQHLVVLLQFLYEVNYDIGKNQSSVWYLGTTRSNAIDMVRIYNLFYFMFLEMLIPIRFGIKSMCIFTNNQKRECDNFALNFVPCLLKIVQLRNFSYE
ncbi:hypothetical protein PHAVU_009G188201 [Phaseolus vulgaris]